MSVWMTPYALPADDRVLTHDDFAMLLLRVLHAGFGHVPVTIASGCLSQPLHDEDEGLVYLLGDLGAPATDTFPHEMAVTRYDPAMGDEMAQQGMVTIWYHGADRQAIAHALHALPYGRDDVLVRFGGEHGYPVFSALAEPRTVCFLNAWIGGENRYETTMHACELISGIWHEEDVYDEPIIPLLTEYYGEARRMAYTYF